MEDKDFMLAALELAKEAAADGEVPVGCVITRHGEIVGRGRNRREKGKNALCHAELEAINDACTRLGGWRLWECDLYVTLEPCPMCAGAIINARIPRVVYGAKDLKAGSVDHPGDPGGLRSQGPQSRLLRQCVQPLRHGLQPPSQGGAGPHGRGMRRGAEGIFPAAPADPAQAAEVEKAGGQPVNPHCRERASTVPQYI